jgi:bacterioferritin
MLATGMKLEDEAVKMYNASATLCAEENDQVSKDIFEKILAQEEEHWNYFDNVKTHVKEMGAAYLATLTG